MSEQYRVEKSSMSDAYWELWNSEVQKKIDRDIEANRKADASINLPGVPEEAEVKVEQMTHGYIFGAHTFNFNQLGTTERNQKYRDLFGNFFNSATIAFYWNKFEIEEGKPRFKGEFRDSEEYWNKCTDPKNEIHWRRPATDPIVEHCEANNVRMHGHTLTWGDNRWHTPDWLMDKMPSPYLEKLRSIPDLNENTTGVPFENFTGEEIEKIIPEYTREMHYAMSNRIFDIALYYKDRIPSWDVVNESSRDFKEGSLFPEQPICKSHYGVMPGDYAYKSFKIAESTFPKGVALNINDAVAWQAYTDQTKKLMERGCEIDIMGIQKHLFDPQECLDIADGTSDDRSPQKEWDDLERLGSTGLPLHMSEITLCAPNNDERGQAIQAIIARNLYRLWFSSSYTMGITWWNVVDDCGAAGEPSVSGLFTRNMEPKPAFHALNDLINNEWKTNTTVKAGENGQVEFRGFRGNYKLTWTDENGVESSTELELK